MPAQRRQLRINAGHWLATGNETRREAAQRLIGALDDWDRKERMALIAELSELDIAERVIRAFTVNPMTQKDATVIQVLLDHPGSTSTELSRALGWNGQAWHMHFAKMCENRTFDLWPAPDAPTSRQ